MNYKITDDDFHIFQIKDEENFTKYREEYHDGLNNLCEYVKVACPDDIVDEYKKLAEFVIKLQIQLSLEYCPNSRIHELFNAKEEIQGTTYQAIIDEIDFLTEKIKENKNKVAEINHSIDSFIKFLHSSEFYIYRSHDIIPLTPVYDSELSFLLDVKKRFAVLGETTHYFFEKILDIVCVSDVRILDKYKETIEFFLYPDSGNIRKHLRNETSIESELNELTDSNDFSGINFPSLYKDDNKLIEVFNKLIDGCFLDKSTSTDDFVYFFSGRGKVPEQNLIWIGNNVELAFFVDSYCTKFKNDIPEKWKKAQMIFRRNGLRQALTNSLNSTKESLNKKRYDTFNEILELI